MNIEEKQKKKFWEKRTKLEKVCIVILVIVGVLFTAQLLEILYIYETSTRICENPDCIQAAAEILEFIDPSFDPCEDFYNFTCGTFIKNAATNEEHSPVKVLHKKAQSQMYSIISEEIRENDVNSLKIAKQFFQACDNTRAIEEDNGRTFLSLLEKLGGWPVLKGAQWKEDQFNWIDFTINARRLGLDHSIFFIIYQDFGETNKTEPFILPQYFSKKLKPEHKDDYVNYMTDVAVAFGASKYEASRELRKVMHFEDQLLNIHEICKNKSRDTEEKNLTSITIDAIQAMFPTIPWLNFLNNLTYPSYTFQKDDLIVFKLEEYVKQLMSLFSRTSKRTLANYMTWEVIKSDIIYLKQEIVDRKDNYMSLTENMKKTDEKQKRYKFCTKRLKIVFPYALEAAYGRKYMTPSKIHDIKEMVANIKKEFEILLLNGEWLDDKTRKKALEKLRLIKEYVGCSEEILDGPKFDEKLGYDKIDFNNTSNLIEIITILRKHFYDDYYGKLYNNITDYFYMSITTSVIVTINAYYVHKENKIMIPAATMQGIFYNQNVPKYYNYGALGALIGHEISHGFAEKGGQYGKYGNEEHWWSNETTDAYLEKIACLIEEYNNYNTTEIDIPLNGSVTLEENFADFVGVKIAYRAYQNWLNTHGEEAMLPGINLTPNQLFWITTSLYMCFQARPGQEHLLKIDSPHGIPSFRIVAPLRNTEFFAKDFYCPSGTFMNPNEKCKML